MDKDRPVDLRCCHARKRTIGLHTHTASVYFSRRGVFASTSLGSSKSANLFVSVGVFDIWSDMPYRYVARNTSVDPNRNVPLITKLNTKTEAMVDTTIDSDVAKPYCRGY